jgi:hypothetical protein
MGNRLSVDNLYANNVYEKNAIFSCKTISLDPDRDIELTANDVRAMWELKCTVPKESQVLVLPEDMDESEKFGKPNSGVCIFVRNWTSVYVILMLPNVAFDLQPNYLGFLTWVKNGGWHLASLPMHETDI